MPRHAVNKIDLVGKTFGYWTVVAEESHPRDGGGDARWRCRCTCGVERVLKSGYLRHGKSRSCGCQTAYLKSQREMRIGAVPYRMVGLIRRSAIKRNIPFEVSHEYIAELYERQHGRCALSGVPLATPGMRELWATASLDRKNSTLGYVPDNVQWVHKHVNLMKNTFDQDVFVRWCQVIAENQCT